MTEARFRYLEAGRYARGWHIVLFSQELAVGDVKPLSYFDQDMVIDKGIDVDVLGIRLVLEPVDHA